MTVNDFYNTILIYFRTGDKGKPQINLQWKTVNRGTLKTLQKGLGRYPKQMNSNFMNTL